LVLPWLRLCLGCSYQPLRDCLSCERNSAPDSAVGGMLPSWSGLLHPCRRVRRRWRTWQRAWPRNLLPEHLLVLAKSAASLHPLASGWVYFDQQLLHPNVWAELHLRRHQLSLYLSVEHSFVEADQTHHQRGWHQLLAVPRRELAHQVHPRCRGIAALEPRLAIDAAVLDHQRAISIIDSRTLYHTGSGRNGSGLGHLRHQTFWLEVVHAG